jgi:very-short-patch-repair endonuclease
MIFRACKKAIQEADLVFAWLTGDDDIIGTAWELGFAEGIRKPVVIGIPDGVHNTIPWFLEEASPYVVSGPNPETALKDFLVWLHWFFDSPPELTFWQQWGPRQWGELNLNIQHEVFGGRYRLDFAHLSSQVAIEIDGFTYHGDDAHFTNDRKRDRELSEAGWKVCRFTAKEVMAAPEKCCKQAEAIIRQNVAA